MTKHIKCPLTSKVETAAKTVTNISRTNQFQAKVVVFSSTAKVKKKVIAKQEHITTCSR